MVFVVFLITHRDGVQVTPPPHGVSESGVTVREILELLTRVNPEKAV